MLFLLLVPASAPMNIINIELSARHFVISWDELPTEDENGLVRHYVINITEVNTGIDWYLTSSSPEVTLSDLHPYNNYSIVVAAYTIGTGPFSDPLLITTAQDGNYFMFKPLLIFFFKKYLQVLPQVYNLSVRLLQELLLNGYHLQLIKGTVLLLDIILQ